MFPRKVILRALLCLFLAMLPFPDAENHLYDLKVKLLSRIQFQHPESVLIVEISKENFEALKKRFPAGKNTGFSGMDIPWRDRFEELRSQFFWDDHVYEALLTKLLSQSPKKILVTFFFNESLILLQDNPKLQQLVRDPKIHWASLFDLDQKLIRPASELTGTENYGFSNLHPDPDAIVRRAFLVYRNHLSLPFRTLIEGTQTLTRKIPLSEPFLIRFAGPPGFIQRCSILDVFSDSAPSKCGSLENRYVILAQTGNAMAGINLYRTPVGDMDRGEALANILLTAKNESHYVAVKNYVLILFIFIHILAISMAVLKFEGTQQLLRVALLLFVEALLSLFAMYVFSLQIPVVPFIVGAVTSYFAFLGLKSQSQESRRWQAEKKAQYLRELDELKSNFMSLMSHDLKTPIAKVQALTERLSREAFTLSSDHKNILAAIQKSNDELASYIHSILNFQRIESQELKPHKKSQDINVLVEEVFHRLESLAEDRKIEIRLELEPMFAVELDEQLIRQVLTNLIDNAIKYNHAGTVVIVKTSDLGDFVEVSVQDNGSGIEDQQKERLFKKFSRFEKGTSERVKGTGLGLYLAKYFIELHGGSISMESEIGTGTIFKFKLPIHS